MFTDTSIDKPLILLKSVRKALNLHREWGSFLKKILR